MEKKIYFHLNLATRSYVNRKGLYAVYVLLALVLLGILAFNTTTLLKSRAQEALLRERLAQLHGSSGVTGRQDADPQTVQRLNKRVEFANHLLEGDHYRWTQLFDQLEGLAIDGIGIATLVPDYRGKTLKLTGRARNVQVLRTFLDRLATSRDFSKVYLLQQGAVAEGEDELVFSLSLSRSPGV